MPDLDLDDVTLTTACLGRTLATPFFVAAITAGHANAFEFNRLLARVCRSRGWALGLGSLRRELTDESLLDEWKRFRDENPGLLLLANIGITQLNEVSVQKLRVLLDATGSAGLAVHTNPLQECLQPEGTPSFRGAAVALRLLCEELGRPVILKETGCGFSVSTLERLRKVRLAAIDVSGLGGTHWGRLEGARAKEKDSIRAQAAETFQEWGESTVASIRAARQALPKVEVWASGGIRTGLDAAKTLALGASMVGYAQPALVAAGQGEAALENWMKQQEFELKLALFCTGSTNPVALRCRPGVWRESHGI